MEIVKVKFRPSKTDGKMGIIYYHVAYNNSQKQFTTTYQIYSQEWDDSRGAVALGGADSRAEARRQVARNIRWDLLRFGRIVERCEQECYGLNAEQIVAEFESQASQCAFFANMQRAIDLLKQHGRLGTSENYKATLNSFSRFRCGRDCRLEEIDRSMVADYQAWLLGQGLGQNTVSFYMRVLRAVYNKAVDEGLIADAKPFAKAYTGIGHTPKRAISEGDMRKIKALQLAGKPQLELARDVFLFLFACRGMSFVDAAYLKRSDMRGGRIVYRRHKTSQIVQIGLNPAISAIIKKYEKKSGDYVLPLINKTGVPEWRQYQTALRRVNLALKQIAKLAGIDASLTTYISRHTWATLAKSKAVPLHVISDALGHSSTRTTQIYLDEINPAAVDAANQLVLDDFF